MINDYRNLLNRIAYNQLPSTVKVPDYRLSIGDAESLESIPVLLFTDVYSPFGNPVVQSYQELNYEKVTPNLQGDKLTYDDFTTTGFHLGSPYMGV